MKSLIILSILAAAVFADIENTNFNGRPGCKTPQEIGMAYPNFNDSTHYWRCYAQYVTAISVRCPNEHGFQASLKACVPFTVWTWEKPVMPPSCPDFEQECIPGITDAV